MSTLTIALSKDRLQKLEQIAQRFQIAPEDLVRVSIEELLSLPDEEFRRALELVGTASQAKPKNGFTQLALFAVELLLGELANVLS